MNGHKMQRVQGMPPGDQFARNLRVLLAHTPPGAIHDTKPLLNVLSVCWDEFAGSGDQAMAPYKLHRMEQASWNPPLLTFIIERHGGTVMGSTRAELQRWVVDVKAMTAKCDNVSHRQVSPMQRQLDVKPLAEDVARLIVLLHEDGLDTGFWGVVQLPKGMTKHDIPALYQQWREEDEEQDDDFDDWLCNRHGCKHVDCDFVRITDLDED